MTDGALASSFVYVTDEPGQALPSFVVVAPPGSMTAEATVAAADEHKLSDLVPLAYPLPEGEIEPVKMVTVSKSIVAFESAAPAVTFEKVAAIAATIKEHLR